jgi:hypothetical protein
MVVMVKTILLDQPEEHDYPAAVDYLSPVLEPGQAKKLTSQLQQATTATKKAKDILRASHLQPLGSESVHVRNDLRKIHRGQGLSPVLLIRGDATRDLPLVIADGFHRVCAAHVLDEDAEIPCRIVSSPKTPAKP